MDVAISRTIYRREPVFALNYLKRTIYLILELILTKELNLKVRIPAHNTYEVVTWSFAVDSAVLPTSTAPQARNSAVLFAL